MTRSANDERERIGGRKRGAGRNSGIEQRRTLFTGTRQLQGFSILGLAYIAISDSGAKRVGEPQHACPAQLMSSGEAQGKLIQYPPFRLLLNNPPYPARPNACTPLLDFQQGSREIRSPAVRRSAGGIEIMDGGRHEVELRKRLYSHILALNRSLKFPAFRIFKSLRSNIRTVSQHPLRTPWAGGAQRSQHHRSTFNTHRIKLGAEAIFRLLAQEEAPLSILAFWSTAANTPSPPRTLGIAHIL
ncbi:hypothetical protein BOTBODRAFT_383023 [Botryobasidium botryosum FD-172 SS1]|uniref:Uncharacterized protein n=1 Tax=Botryobasidium botryosum (strain FD-172 SS1) TaxID=930990 RepID=A0A067MZ47_BOTB1|nr:hypothetical protein BOTBODRAFT_383023 [Botryobasidium botryosum FD-172 SS1]